MRPCTAASVFRRWAIPLALLLTVGCTASDPEAAIDKRLATLDLQSRIALLIAAPASLVRLDSVDAAVARWAGYPEGRSPATLWVDSATVEGLHRLRDGLDGRAAMPLLGAVVDEGVGSVVAGATRFPAVGDLLYAGWEGEQLRALGEVLGREAGILGLSIPIVHSPPLRHGPDPSFLVEGSEELREGAASLLSAARSGGARLGIGLFSTEGAPDDESLWDRARFEAVEAGLVRGAIEGEGVAIMVGSSRLTALSAEGAPASLSPSIVTGIIRRDSGWNGIVITDLRELSDSLSEVGKALHALAAGADLIITPGAPPALIDSLTARVNAGEMPRSRIDDAARRIIALQLAPSPATFTTADSTIAALAESGGQALMARAFSYMSGLSDRTLAPSDSSADHIVDWLDPGEAPASALGMSSSRLMAADRVIRAALADSVFTAAALVVGRGGGLARFRGYGTLEDGSGDVDPRTTIFDLASLSKVVGTISAVAHLVERGDLDLDAPVARYLDSFQGGDRERVTIRHLLTHTSGLPSGLWLFGSASSRDEAIGQVLEQELVREPGESVEYSDLGMILLAAIVERVAETPMDVFLAAHLLVPLGMASTMYLPPITVHDRIVPTVDENERPYPLRGTVHDANAFRLDGVAGHAGVFSTARDVALFSQMMLGRGQVAGVRVLADSTVGAFTTRQPGAEERALGWDTPANQSSAGRFASARTFGHTGYTGTSIWIDPEYDLYVVLLTNRTFTEGSGDEMLDLRTDVHEAVYQAIVDRPVARRPLVR